MSFLQKLRTVTVNIVTNKVIYGLANNKITKDIVGIIKLVERVNENISSSISNPSKEFEVDWSISSFHCFIWWWMMGNNGLISQWTWTPQDHSLFSHGTLSEESALNAGVDTKGSSSWQQQVSWWQGPAGERRHHCFTSTQILFPCVLSICQFRKTSSLLATWPPDKSSRCAHRCAYWSQQHSADGEIIIYGTFMGHASQRKDMMLQQIPSLLLIWQPWACRRSSCSCLGLLKRALSWSSCGRLSKSNLSTWMAILETGRGRSSLQHFSAYKIFPQTDHQWQRHYCRCGLMLA